MIQCKFNPPLLFTFSIWLNHPIPSYRTHFSDLEMFVEILENCKVIFFLAPTIQRTGCHRCTLGTTRQTSKEGILLSVAGFLSSSSACYLLCKCEGLWAGPWCYSSLQLFPASRRGWSRGETCGRAGRGLRPTQPSFRQGPSVSWWEKSQREVRLLSDGAHFTQGSLF